MRTVRRGYLPEYDKMFGEMGVLKLKEAAIDALFLLNRGYELKRAVQIAIEHYQLSDMQRLALSRGLDTDIKVNTRQKTRLDKADLHDHTVYIDGFNAVILMESIVSNSPVFKCLDGAVRDLANLKGSYKIIDKTEAAIRLILNELHHLGVKKAIFNIDSPVSNSRNLKCLILKQAEHFPYETEVNLVDACDISFYGRENVITGDCIVIDNAASWAPFYAWIIEEYQKTHPVWLIDFTAMNLHVIA